MSSDITPRFALLSARAWVWLPYPLLAVSLALSVATSVGGADDIPLVAVGTLTLVAVAWTVLVRARADRSPRWAALYIGGRSVAALCLVLLAPWFGIFAWFGYLESLRYLRQPWWYGGLAATAAVTAFSYLGGAPDDVTGWLIWVGVVAGGCVLVSFFALAAQRSGERDQEREDALAALQVANSRLETALTENRGLQAQLMAQAREAGVLDERARLAGEIHDTLAQTLAGIVTQLDASGESGPRVTRARALAHDGLTEARRTLSAMRPTELVGTRLADAIRDTTSQWSADSGVPVACDVTGDPMPLDTDAEVALLRVAQESLANVARHARASKVAVTLTYLGDVVLLDVRDDGIGYDPDAVPVDRDGHHVGLATMAERLRRVGGGLTVDTEPGRGVSLVATVPA